MASIEIKPKVAGKRVTPEEAGEAEVKLENTVREGNAGKDPVEQALPQIETAQNATKGLIAATNAAQADAAVAEQMQPINQTIDFLNLYNKRQAAELAREKEKETKRINLERLGHDIASIAASVGDMTRASEGAPVAPRDWQRTYDNLTAQERANIDNYRVRMAKLHEDEKNARMAQAQAQAKAIGEKQKQDYDLKKLMFELGWKGDQASYERAKDIFLKMLDSQSRANVANIYNEGKKAQYDAKLKAYTSTVPFNGKLYYFEKGKWNDVSKDITGMLAQNYKIETKFLQEFNNFKSEKELEIALRNFLAKKEIVENPEYENLKKDIERTLAERSYNVQLRLMADFDANQTTTTPQPPAEEGVKGNENSVKLNGKSRA